MSEALTVPILPHTAPEAKQPAGLRLPLYPHQLRALHRCLVIEQDGSLGTDFGDRFDYKSRGGCLADSVGTGKTAVSIGLCLAGTHRPSTEYQLASNDTLVVAPAHLIPQWKSEIEKMASPEALEVVVGVQEYEKTHASIKPRIVLVDVDTVLKGKKLWYDWRRVFRNKDGNQVRVSEERMTQIREAALFSVRSPRGPCSYTGWVYTDSIHIPKRPWRRVIFDEIQDLVSGGESSGKNLLQLSRTAQSVWLLSATPFPHGNESIYANHELLGFCRLRMKIDVRCALPAHHTFERIKRRLYIRSPRHVADGAVKTKVTRNTVVVSPLDLETRFSQLEIQAIQSEGDFPRNCSMFTCRYNSVREMTVHPEASEELRKQMAVVSASNPYGATLSVSGSVDAAARRAVSAAKHRLHEVESRGLSQLAKDIRDTRKSLSLAEKVAVHRDKPLAANPFAGPNNPDLVSARQEKENSIIHDHYCGCKSAMSSSSCYADKNVFFRIFRVDGMGPEFIHGKCALHQATQYFRNELHSAKRVNVGHGSTSALQNYISVTQRTLKAKEKSLGDLEKEKSTLKQRIQTLSQTSSTGNVKHEEDVLAQTHGSKPAALIRFLRSLVDANEQAIVFSFWHDTLKLIGQTLSKCGLESVFCSGRGVADALQKFNDGVVPILLLSAKSKASGANLQCATHVILLDPAGSSPEHGSALEEQAIGRAVRMGQTRPVTVTRFCVMGSIEEHLFRQIDEAAQKAKALASGSSYVIQDAHLGLHKRDATASDNYADDIKVTAALSVDERLRRRFLKAEEQGGVIDLESDDESAPKTTTGFSCLVKQEQIPQKRNNPMDGVDNNANQKRTRTDEIIPVAVSSAPAKQKGDTTYTVTPLKCDRMEKVRVLLCRLDLAEYVEQFAGAGYDSLDFLYACSENRAVMDKLTVEVGLKPGHAVRFQFGLAKEARQNTKITEAIGNQAKS